MKEEIVVGNRSGLRLDSYLSLIFKDYSRSQISRSIKDARVLVNSKKVKPSYLVEEGDLIGIESLGNEEAEILAQKMDLDIVYEDEYLLVLNKPRGMVVHPGVGNYRDTLVNGLLYYTDKLSRIGGDFRPGIVHRLDKDTSGLLLVAKDDETHEFLSNQLISRSMKREYLALVDGFIEENDGQVDQPIGRDPSNRLKMCVIDRNSKEALTTYKVLERFDKYTYIRAALDSGRMHQIRVHMNYIGHPIVGDQVYGRGQNEFKLDNQLLHSYKLGFIHPASGEYMELESYSCKDLERVLKLLRKRRQ